MDQINKLKIGVFYNYDERWIAGSNYIINFLLSISSNNLSKKVEIKLICRNEHRNQIERLNLSNIDFYEADKQVYFKTWERIVNRFFRTFSKRNLLKGKQKHNPLEVDYVFPVQLGMSAYKELISPLTTPIFWIPDFQDKYYPDFFSSVELNDREMFYQYIINTDSPVVFSSYACLNDFRRFYPNSKNQSLVYRFRSENISMGLIDKNIREKYNLPSKFFYCPNQFWKHKNQTIVLESLEILKNINSDIFIVFSGKESDYRNPDYFNEIKDYIAHHNLSNLKILGFIPEEDKKSIFHYAHAIIQPSLFEGWSTLVEEAKTLEKHIILSDIPVHREQIKSNCTFFSPLSATNLAMVINEIWLHESGYYEGKNEPEKESDMEKLISDLFKIKSEINS